MKKVTSYLFLIILFFSCENENERNIEAYYFPFNELKNGKVYEYQSTGSEYDPPLYWYYKSIKQDGAWYLLGTGYDTEFSPDQFVREEKSIQWCFFSRL